jgi:hypothetical protein
VALPFYVMCILLILHMSSYTPGHAAALRDAHKPKDYFVDHACPEYAIRAVSLEILGRLSPGLMQFLCGATHADFPQQGHQCATCFASVY